MFFSARFALVLVGFGFMTQAPAVGTEELRAGFARIDITPTKPVILAGYASRKELSQGVHDPLTARAAVFELSGKRITLVSVENLGFYNDTAPTLRQEILRNCQLEPSGLFLSAIHTHSAPTLALDPQRTHTNNVEYTHWLRSKLAELVQTALSRLEPVQLGVGSGSSPVGANRREVVRDNSGNQKVVLGRNPSLLTDREVQVLALKRANDAAPAAVLFDYATHSTSLGPGNYLISGDIHGLAAQFVERYLGSGIRALPFAGASGNIDPWYRVLPGFNTNNGWIPEPVLLGTLLGEEVVHVLAGIRGWNVLGPITTSMKTLELPRKSSGATNAASPVASATAPFVLTIGCIGDIAFVGLGGEVFNEIGQVIKSSSPFQHTFVITQCNGAGGYVPTRAAYPEGGYEVTTTPFAPGADTILAEESIRMLRELKSERK